MFSPDLNGIFNGILACLGFAVMCKLSVWAQIAFLAIRPVVANGLTATCRAGSKVLLFFTRDCWAFARTPLGAFYYLLVIANCTFGTWGEIAGSSQVLEIGQGVTVLGWMTFGSILAWMIGKAVVKGIKGSFGR